MSPEFLCDMRVRIRVFTKRKQLALAEEAIAARDRKRHDDAIAYREILDTRAELYDLAHEFVSENIAPIHRGNVAVVQMQIRSADRRARYLDHRIARIDDVWIGNVLHTDFV